ncbi:toll/interleukin-1 receptor domain-containing protein [Bradyrhizobium sp. TM102]|uniref:toll/interleukin-1 receptor domain-containing protein n=1 Tax=Bradyrhizobium sp. TM102 TaxID=2599819 RepID=UPI0012604422|nr:toll/interleukin-1 receptor domain-containing protein [Bradyrhizobium sp. TM102]BBO08723.1 hypothetical protein TM102_01930 [Bradyrhizobium sp. TM102]
MVALRDSVFISHATPEDNAFTLWLGGRLTALGYHVFADILRLKGGDDWERILEDAIRQRAKRFLLVGTPGGIQKQGVRNEINLAVETAKKIGDGGFIVPLRLAAYPPPLQIAHTQYINFEKGWAQGLAELLPLLEEANVPKHVAPEETKAWQSLQLKDARSVGNGPEQLVSNWLDVTSLPTSIAFFDFKSGISIGAAQKARADCPIPIAVHNRGFLSFAPLHQLQEYFGPNLPIEVIDSWVCQCSATPQGRQSHRTSAHSVSRVLSSIQFELASKAENSNRHHRLCHTSRSAQNFEPERSN